MRKKIFSVLAVLLVVVTTASAYTPAVGGDAVFDLSSPFALTYGSSVAGGGIFSADPTSIISNPALTAHEQRVGLNVGYTALVLGGDNSAFGNAFQAGLMIPFKWAVLTGYLNGTFPGDCLPFQNSVNIKAGLSKEITEHLCVGVGLNTGLAFGSLNDWLVSANLGFFYDIPTLGFMSDFRFGASILNLGKNFAPYPESEFLDSYPGFGTIKVGAAGIMVSTDVIKLGASLDLTTPLFQNLIVDAGLQFIVKDMLTICVSEKINLVESLNDIKNYIPSVGIFFKFTFNVKGNDYLASHDWSENEMKAGVAYKNLYENIHAISAGADLLLGMKDEKPPVIQIWQED